jgi:hypothetical protein
MSAAHRPCEASDLEPPLTAVSFWASQQIRAALSSRSTRGSCDSVEGPKARAERLFAEIRGYTTQQTLLKAWGFGGGTVSSGLSRVVLRVHFSATNSSPNTCLAYAPFPLPFGARAPCEWVRPARAQTLLQQSLARADHDRHKRRKATRASGEAGGLDGGEQVTQHVVANFSDFLGDSAKGSENTGSTTKSSARSQVFEVPNGSDAPAPARAFGGARRWR